MNKKKERAVKDLWSKLNTCGNMARLTNNGKPLYSSHGEDIFIVCINFLISAKDYVKANDAGAFEIPSNFWQRLDSWTLRKYIECLKTLRDGGEINQFHFAYNGGWLPLWIMDAGHRTRMFIAWLLGREVITSPNDIKVTLKIADSHRDVDKKAKKVVFNDLTPSTKACFENKMLDCLLYFPITESNWEKLLQNPGRFNVGEYAVDLEKSNNKEMKVEYNNWIQENFRKLQNGEQMNANDLAKASSKDGEAYFSNQLEDIAKKIPGSMCDKTIGVKTKTDMLARICHTIEIFSKGYKSGSRIMPTVLETNGQIPELIDKYNNEDRDVTKSLIRQLKTLLNNYNDTHEIFHNHITSYKPSFDTSFDNGKCFPISTGWLLISFYFMWAKRNYVIDDQNDKIAIAKMIGDFFKKASAWRIARKDDQSAFITDEPDDKSSLDHIAWEWIYIKNSSSGKSYNKDYWNLLVRTMDFTGLTKQGERITFDEATVNAVAASQNNQDVNGDPLPQQFDIHHKLPRSKGGTNDIDNLVAVSPASHKKIHAA